MECGLSPVAPDTLPILIIDLTVMISAVVECGQDSQATRGDINVNKGEGGGSAYILVLGLLSIEILLRAWPATR
jgi:hypothetical protein